MTTIRKIVTSKVDGDSANNTSTNEIRPFGEIAVYLDTSGNVDQLTLMMFDGQRTHLKSKVLKQGVLFGSNADSGDGNGLDTIKLIPDAELHSIGSHQYLIIDPTEGEPGHIHLRAGGTQDASSADLYLGGELTCVRVSDTSGIVTIRTTNVGDPNVTLDWSFQQDGNLYFPGIGNNRIGESEPGLVVSSDYAVVIQSNNNGESKEWLYNTDGTITFPDSTVQTSAWTKRIVSVPESSVGTTGDLLGDLAFNSTHMYYCTQNFGGTVITITSITSTASQSYLTMYDSNTGWTSDDLTGYTVTGPGGYTGTVTGASVNVAGSLWHIPVSPNVTQNFGDYVFTSPSGNIWKRIAWSGDTW